MFRPDGSIRSSNYPAWDNRYQVRHYGTYRGVIRDVIYTDDDRNDSGGDDGANEVVYNIMIVGGDLDGQIFANARLMYRLGGFANFEEYTLKKLEDPTTLDISDPEAQYPLNKANGDVVYVQFVNGIPNLPLIVGFGHHQKAPPEAAESDGPRKVHKYNGIGLEISRDGEFKWSKDNGAFVTEQPTLDDPLYLYMNQFAPFPTGEDAVTITLGNKYDFEFAYDTGLSFTIDGVADEYSLGTKVGTTLTISGTEDSFDLATNAGAEYKVSGLEDSHTLSTSAGTQVEILGTTDEMKLTSAAGAAYALSGVSDSHDFTTTAGTELKVDGTEDSITLSAAFGDSLSVSAADGIQASTPTGTSLSMKNGQVDLASGGQASLSLTKTGFVKLGNAAGGDVIEILQQVIQALSTEAPAGFGAPLVNAATYIQLLTKIMLITGG